MYDVRKNPGAARLINALRVEVSDSGYARLDSVWCYHNVCSPYSRLYIIRAGEGVVDDHRRRVPLLPGHVCLIPAGLTFDHWCEEYLEKLYFHVNVILPDGADLFARCPQPLDMAISMDKVASLSDLYLSGRVEDALLLQQGLYALLGSLVEQSGLSSLAIKTYSPTLSRAFQYIQQNLSSQLTVRSLAAHLNMSESTLAKKFRAESGMTIGGYVDGLLLDKAKKLLVSSEMTIGQIAERLCFCDQFYFSRFFSQRQGITPSQYRKAQQHVI